MPRPNRGYWLECLKPKGYAQHYWFICWYSKGRKKFKSTGCVRADSIGADRAFKNWLENQKERPTGPSDPDELMIATALNIYLEELPDSVADAGRLAYAAMNLKKFWTGTVSTIKGETCRRYAKWSKNGPGTIRKELGTLRAAVRYCHQEGYLTSVPGFWLPPKPPTNQDWLTREHVAALLWEAKKPVIKYRRGKEPLIEDRFHLVMFILIALYTGARKTSVLALQWQPNFDGGHIDLERGLIQFAAVGADETSKRKQLIKIPRRLMTFLRYARKRTRTHPIEYQGQPVKSVRRSLTGAAKRAELPRITPHTFKHTSITWRMQRGLPIREVADFHRTTEEVIRKTYYHHHPEYQKEAVDAF